MNLNIKHKTKERVYDLSKTTKSLAFNSEFRLLLEKPLDLVIKNQCSLEMKNKLRDILKGTARPILFVDDLLILFTSQIAGRLRGN